MWGTGLRDWWGAHLVESHLEDVLWCVTLLLGAQVVAQLLRHLLHHVVPQLHVAHLAPRVLVVLDEFGQVEPQALAELMQDPEGAGKAGAVRWGMGGEGGEVSLPVGHEEGKEWVRAAGDGVWGWHEAGVGLDLGTAGDRNEMGTGWKAEGSLNVGQGLE